MILLTGCPSILLSVLLHYFPKMSCCLLQILSLLLWPLYGFFLTLPKGRFPKLFSQGENALSEDSTSSQWHKLCSNQFLFLFSLEVAQNKFYLGNVNNQKQQENAKLPGKGVNCEFSYACTCIHYSQVLL